MNIVELIRALHDLQLEVELAQPRNQRGISHFGNAVKALSEAKRSLILASRREDKEEEECVSQSSASPRGSSRKPESGTSLTTDVATASNGRADMTTTTLSTPREPLGSDGRPLGER